MKEQFKVDHRNKIKRVPDRGHYDKATLYSILDAEFICHVGFVIDGQPFVIPTAYGRNGDKLYIHGSSKSRMLANLKEGLPVCITVTQVNGLVLARSAFHHSMNYRSAVVFGTARIVDALNKEAALFTISEHMLPGRWQEVRPPNAIELKATTVLEVSIEQASSKIRTGPPKDDKEDYGLLVWAGVVPIKKVYEKPVADDQLPEEIEMTKCLCHLV